MGVVWEWIRGDSPTFLGITYRGVGLLVGLAGFAAAWIASIYGGGFLGFLFGWIPSLLVGALLGFIWPLIALCAAAGAGYFMITTWDGVPVAIVSSEDAKQLEAFKDACPEFAATADRLVRRPTNPNDNQATRDFVAAIRRMNAVCDR